MDLGDLFPAVVTFVAIGVLLAFGLNVQGTIGNSFTAGSYEKNATNNALQANDNLSKNLPILGTIIVAAVVIGVLVKAFVIR
jgi:ABC-type spermidine/putrescine transport system permease subunit II